MRRTPTRPLPAAAALDEAGLAEKRVGRGLSFITLAPRGSLWLLDRASLTSRLASMPRGVLNRVQSSRRQRRFPYDRRQDRDRANPQPTSRRLRPIRPAGLP